MLLFATGSQICQISFILRKFSLSQGSYYGKSDSLQFASVTLSYSIMCSSFLFYWCTVITELFAHKSYLAVVWCILESISYPYFGQVFLHSLPDKIKSSAAMDSAGVKQQLVIKGWRERWSQEHDGGNARNDCASIGQREFGMLHCQM